jgi:GT2 family glycosyltransferase
MELSVVWLNYNSGSFLSIARASLLSVLKQDAELDLHLVDNCSRDESGKVLYELARKNITPGKRLHFLRADRNLGYAGGMTYGYLSISAPSGAICFVANDVVLRFDKNYKKI